jgi:AcrR family transcriptional regulator
MENNVLNPDNKISSRDKLVDSAQRLLREKGYQATGIKDILEDSKVSRSNLYYHFTTKRSLAEAVIAVWHVNLQQVFKNAVGIEANYRQQVDSFVQVFIDIQTSDPFAVCPFGRLALELGDTEPALRELINKVFIEFQVEVTKLIKKGIQAGEFKSDTDPNALANALLVAIEGGIVISRAQGSVEAMTTACRYILNNA